MFFVMFIDVLNVVVLLIVLIVFFLRVIRGGGANVICNVVPDTFFLPQCSTREDSNGVRMIGA